MAILYKDVGKKIFEKNNDITIQKFSTSYDVDAIKNSIRNVILTPLGTLPGNPNFGSRVHEMVFEGINVLTKSVIEDFVVEALNKYEPRVRVNEVDVSSVPEYNRMTISIKFQFIDKNTGEVITTSTNISYNTKPSN
jgi:phage baseplate assembly protein W